MIFPGSRRAAGETGVAARPQVSEAGAGDPADLGDDAEPGATRRFAQFAGRPIPDFTQPLRVPKNLVDLSDRGGQAARRLGDLAIELIRAGRSWSDRLLTWAADRPVAPNSVTLIALLAALCATAWFSGGSGGDEVRGFLAVAVWALARICARQLAVATAQRDLAGSNAGGQSGRRPRLAIGATPGHTDWLVLPAFNWTPDHPEPTVDRTVHRRWPTAPPFRRIQAAASAASTPGAAAEGAAASREAALDTESVRKFAWLATVCTRAAECAIYGGIAAGAESAGWSGTWSFAMVIVIFVCAADVAQTCSRAVAGRRGQPAPDPAPGPASIPTGLGAVRAGLGAVLTVPAGARVLVAALLVIAYSPRMALFAVLVISVLSLIRSIFRAARGGRGASAAGQDVVLALRDDGALARWTGRLMLGNLMPLPPALAGLTAILVLAWVGMRQLPGVVAFTPIVVLLLAAPGSSHPHDGRLDWLVPAVLCFGQFSFLAAFGQARSVPNPIVFSACALTAIWYAGIVAGLNYPIARPKAQDPAASRKQRINQIIAREQPPGVYRIGWEGRVSFIAVCGMFGLTMFGYLGLSAFLAALICRNAAIHYLSPDRRPRAKRPAVA